MLNYNRKQKGYFTHASQGSGGWGKENQPQIPSHTSSSGDQRDVSRSILQTPYVLKGGLDTPCTGQTGFLALYAGITLVVLKELYIVLGIELYARQMLSPCPMAPVPPYATRM